MKRYRIISGFTVAYLTVGYLLAACANGQTVTEQDASEVRGTNSPSASDLQVESAPIVIGEPESISKTAKEKVSLGLGLQRLVDLAKQDLGARLGVEPAAIEVLQADYVTWRDSSLGCPRPGYQYLQVLTNGSRIRLGARKRFFQYHSGDNRPPFLCEKPSAIGPLPNAPGES